MALGRGGTSLRGVVSFNTGPAERSMAQLGYKVRQDSRAMKGDIAEVDTGMSNFNKTLIAGIAAWGAYGAAGISALSELRGEMLQSKYLFEDMSRARFSALEMQARTQSGQFGVGAPQVSQAYFRLASTGTAAGQLPTSAGPILQAAAALRTDPSGLALSVGQGSSISGMGHAAYLDSLIRTAQLSTTDIPGLQRLAPRALVGGNALGIGGRGTLGLLAAATQVSGTPEEATTGLVAAFAEAVNKDSKFSKAFRDAFGKSFLEAMNDEGAQGFLSALQMAYAEFGKEGFFSLFGRRAAMVASPLAASGAAGGIVSGVETGSQGALSRMWVDWATELPHSLNLVKEAVDELRYNMGEGAQSGVIGALNKLTETLNQQDIAEAIRNMGQSFGQTAMMLADLTAVAAGIASPVVNLASMDIAGSDLSVMDAAGFAFGGAAALRYGGRLGRRAGGGNTIGGAATMGQTGRVFVGGTRGGQMDVESVSRSQAVGRGARAVGGMALRGAGYVGAGIMANEMIEAATGFDILGESVGKLVSAFDFASDKIANKDWHEEYRKAMMDGKLSMDELNNLNAIRDAQKPAEELAAAQAIQSGRWRMFAKPERFAGMNMDTKTYEVEGDWDYGFRRLQTQIANVGGLGGFMELYRQSGYSDPKQAAIDTVERYFRELGGHNEESLSLLAAIRNWTRDTASGVKDIPSAINRVVNNLNAQNASPSQIQGQMLGRTRAMELLAGYGRLTGQISGSGVGNLNVGNLGRMARELLDITQSGKQTAHSNMVRNQMLLVLEDVRQYMAAMRGGVEEIAANTAPQRDYRFYRAPIVSPDMLLTGG